MPTRSSPARYFLALWPGEAERDALSRCQQALTWPPTVRLTPPQKVHVTLHFIGQLAPRQRVGLVEALAVETASFDTTFDRLELWRHGLAVASASRIPAALHALHARLGERLVALDLPVDFRPYQPHVTLAREAGSTLPPGALPGCTWHSDGYVLVESAGGRYTTVARYGVEAAR
jgi:2'-5' RNA ligase